MLVRFRNSDERSERWPSLRAKPPTDVSESRPFRAPGWILIFFRNVSFLEPCIALYRGNRIAISPTANVERMLNGLAGRTFASIQQAVGSRSHVNCIIDLSS